jgi:hypothetical protein
MSQVTQLGGDHLIYEICQDWNFIYLETAMVKSAGNSMIGTAEPPLVLDTVKVTVESKLAPLCRRAVPTLPSRISRDCHG